MCRHTCVRYRALVMARIFTGGGRQGEGAYAARDGHAHGCCWIGPSHARSCQAADPTAVTAVGPRHFPCMQLNCRQNTDICQLMLLCLYWEAYLVCWPCLPHRVCLCFHVLMFTLSFAGYVTGRDSKRQQSFCVGCSAHPLQACVCACALHVAHRQYIRNDMADALCARGRGTCRGWQISCP